MNNKRTQIQLYLSDVVGGEDTEFGIDGNNDCLYAFPSIAHIHVQTIEKIKMRELLKIFVTHSHFKLGE